MTGYKLVRMRRNGTLGPLFINRRQVLEVGVWMPAGDYPTKGFAHRPGWHVLLQPVAPHLSKKGRIWIRVEAKDYVEFERPVSQGGKWLLAQWMKII